VTAWIALAAIVVATWNGNWFPSGRAEHRAAPEVEEATVAAAAKMLSDGLLAVDPHATNDVVLCLQEMRGGAVVSNLVSRIGRKGLNVAVVSGYRRRDRFDTQQDAIATTLPVKSASWSLWRRYKRQTPPRGFAFAELMASPDMAIRIYSVHLKSNYRQKGDAEIALNRAKRTRSVEQLVAKTQARRALPRPTIIAGDFNADRWRAEFADEPLFLALDLAGFVDVLAALPPDRRETYPNQRFGGSALDHVFCRGFAQERSPVIVPNENLSDHRAVFAVLTVRQD